MAQTKAPSPELDADLENDLLEWSEDNNIDNIALVSLFNLLKSHNLKKDQEPSISSTSKSQQDKKWIGTDNIDLVDRLTILERGQQTIITEISKILSPNLLNIGPTTMRTECFLDDFKIPFTTAREFINFEKKCKNNFNIQEKLKSMFMNTLENDSKKFIHSCIQKLLNDECAAKFSWNGKMNNIAIKDYTTIDILKECVLTIFSDMTEQDVDKNIVTWFHRATDRKRKKKSDNSEIIDKFDMIEEFDTNDDEIEDLSSCLPCKTIIEFKKLDSSCRINAYLEDKLRCLFASCNAFDISNFIATNMRKLLSDDIINDISWTGINTKICLRNMFIVKILIEVIMERFHLDAEDKVIPLIRRWTYSIRDNNDDHCDGDYSNKPIKLENNDRTTIEMEFIDPLNMSYQEEYGYYEEEDVDIISSLPCTTDEQYVKLEKLCAVNQKLQYDLKEFFKKTKNLDYKSFTDYNMRQMINDDVANILKISTIKDYVTINAIKEAIFDTFPNVSDFGANDAIKLYLYKAQDRFRKKVIRVSIKQEQEDAADSQHISQESLSIDGYDDGSDDEPDIEYVSHLPCLTYRQFLKFEKRFRMDENLKSELRELFMNDSDETSIKKFIDINFKKLMEDEATIHCIWGTGFSSASSLKNFGIIKLLRECALEVFPHITTDLVNDDIRSFLYRTKERVKRKSLKVQGSPFIAPKKRKFNRVDVKVKSESYNLFGVVFNFPLSTVEAFEEFEKECQKNEQYQENLETFYNRMRNCDHLTFIDKNIRKLINEEVSGAFTWHGRQGNKAAKDFTCIKVLKDCVENIYPEIIEKEIIDSFTRAFRRAKDRKLHTSKNFDESVDFDSAVQDSINSTLKEETKMDFDGDGYDSVEENDSVTNGSEIDYEIMNLSCMPFHNVDDFKKFEKICRRNLALQKNLRNHFDSHREMLDPKKFTAENLRKMLPDDLAAQFSYAGQQKNISIKNYTTMKILKEVTMSRYNLVDSMAISILKRCFYMVKDRVRIRNKLKSKSDVK